MHEFWALLSELGNSKWVLPAACLLVLLSGENRWRIGVRWLGALALACLVTLASKLAFMGWGVGSRALDFTGFSGHATAAAGVYPVALALLAGPRWRVAGAAAGVALALLIGYSRLPLQAHSVSEVAGGLALGLACSGWYFLGGFAQMRVRPWASALAVLLSVSASQQVMPGVATQDLVVRMAKAMSGRDVVYNRAWLSKDLAASQGRTRARVWIVGGRMQ